MTRTQLITQCILFTLFLLGLFALFAVAPGVDATMGMRE